MPQPTPTPQVVGVASWYGPDFTAAKARPAASMTRRISRQPQLRFHLGSRRDGHESRQRRSVEVTITDRGPFLKDRKIVSLHKAARA